ncbi:right-handed parallel beta-helix repeat-containing protein [Chryseobacterium sp. Alg-005]|uniref:right-handed parallel beta-helix repeat-containing protein n=1 Tax=Chryseobacterium sp. Alg-005 TaxID=3159516 RepID=UPI0036F2E618
MKKNIVFILILCCFSLIKAQTDTLVVSLQSQSVKTDFTTIQNALSNKSPKPLKIILNGNFFIDKTLVTARDHTIIAFAKNATLNLRNENEGGLIIAHNNVTVKGGAIIGNGLSTKDFYKGYGILLSGAKNGTIKNIILKKISGIGLFIANAGEKGSSNNTVINNKFINSAMNLGQSGDTLAILLGYSGYNYSHDNNVIKNNLIDGDNQLKIGIGIIGHGNNNIIENNTIQNLLDYGVMAYESQAVGGTLNKTIIRNNTITNIGEIGNKQTVKGMGIYIMKSHNSIIEGNKVSYVLRNSDRTETLTQGAIASSGGENVKIINNTISESPMYGIVMAYGFNSEISNNKINNVKKSGIYLINLNDIQIKKNILKNVGDVVFKGKFGYTGDQIYSNNKLLNKHQNEFTGKNISIVGNEVYSPKELVYFAGDDATNITSKNIISNIDFSDNIVYGQNIKINSLINYKNTDGKTTIKNNKTIRSN